MAKPQKKDFLDKTVNKLFSRSFNPEPLSNIQ